MSSVLKVSHLRRFVEAFWEHDATLPDHVSEADFAGDGASGDLALFNALRDRMTCLRNLYLFALVLGLKRFDLRQLIQGNLMVEQLQQYIIETPIDDDFYYTDKTGRRHRYVDEPLAKRVTVYYLEKYVQLLKRGELLFDYESFATDWRETIQTDRAAATGAETGEARRCHAVKEFWRRHPRSGEKTVRVKAHLRGSRERSLELLSI